MSRLHLCQFLVRAAGLFPDRPALGFGGREQTWIELNRATEELAGGLRSLGVGKGDRVAILALNSDRYVEFFYAAWRLSAVVVPINTRCSKDEVGYALADSRPRVIVVDDAFAGLVEDIARRRTATDFLLLRRRRRFVITATTTTNSSIHLLLIL